MNFENSPVPGQKEKNSINRREFTKRLAALGVFFGMKIAGADKLISKQEKKKAKELSENDWEYGIRKLWESSLSEDREKGMIFSIDGKGRGRWIDKESSTGEGSVMMETKFFSELAAEGITEIHNFHTHPLSSFVENNYFDGSRADDIRKSPERFRREMPMMPPSFPDLDPGQKDIGTMFKLEELAAKNRIKIVNYVIDPGGIWTYEPIRKELSDEEREKNSEYQKKISSLTGRILENESVKKSRAPGIYKGDPRNFRYLLEYLEYPGRRHLDQEARDLVSEIRKLMEGFLKDAPGEEFDHEFIVKMIETSGKRALTEEEMSLIEETYRKVGIKVKYHPFK